MKTDFGCISIKRGLQVNLQKGRVCSRMGEGGKKKGKTSLSDGIDILLDLTDPVCKEEIAIIET